MVVPGQPDQHQHEQRIDGSLWFAPVPVVGPVEQFDQANGDDEPMELHGYPSSVAWDLRVYPGELPDMCGEPFSRGGNPAQGSSPQ